MNFRDNIVYIYSTSDVYDGNNHSAPISLLYNGVDLGLLPSFVQEIFYQPKYPKYSDAWIGKYLEIVYNAMLPGVRDEKIDKILIYT